jgi:hypothetical protein
MPRSTALLTGLLCACSFPAAPTLLPPPFGPDPGRPEPARFFFPNGIAIDPAGWVVVANANGNREFDAGAAYSLRSADLLQYFPPGTAAGTIPFPAAALAGKAMIGNYTGPLVLAAGTAYSASRDSNRLNAVALDPATGALSCRTGAAVEVGNEDCRAGVIDLSNAARVEGPFGIAVGKVLAPGAAAEVDVAVLVSSLVPRIDQIQSGVAFTSSHLAALDARDPSNVLFDATVTDRLRGGGVGAGSMVYDDLTREVILVGCYTRFGSASAGGEPSTLKCASNSGSNILRFVPVDAGSSAAPRLYELGAQLRATDTPGLALGNLEVVTTPPAAPRRLRTLYVATRTPDTIARIRVPVDDPALAPFADSIVPVGSQPSQVLRLQRPPDRPGTELVAVTAVATYQTSTANGKLILVDGTLGQVVGQVDGLGDTPAQIAQFPPQAGEASARLAITVFGSCRLSLVDVPYDRPNAASIVANLGSCP